MYKRQPAGIETSYSFAGDGATAEVLVLANGQVSVVDRGTAGLNRFCDAAGGHLTREVGLAVIDPSLGEATVFPAPTSFQQAAAERLAVELLGEFQVDESRSHVLLSAGRALWSVDTGRGSWTLLTIAGNAESPDFPYVLSDSGTRLYGAVDSNFQLIDLLANPDGSLGFVATLSPIRSTITTSLVADGEISFATDEDIFLSHSSNTFRFPVPPALR